MNMQKPEIVHKAQIILYAALAVGIVRVLMEFSRISQQATTLGGMGVAIAIQLFVFLSVGLLIFFIGKRKNWARYIYLVLFVLGVPFSILPLMQSLQSEPISGVLGFGQLVAQAVALVLLFRAQAREWFKYKAADLKQ